MNEIIIEQLIKFGMHAPLIITNKTDELLMMLVDDIVDTFEENIVPYDDIQDLMEKEKEYYIDLLDEIYAEKGY